MIKVAGTLLVLRNRADGIIFGARVAAHVFVKTDD